VGRLSTATNACRVYTGLDTTCWMRSTWARRVSSSLPLSARHWSPPSIGPLARTQLNSPNPLPPSTAGCVRWGMAMDAYKCSLSSPSKTGARVRVSPHSIVMEHPRMPSYHSTPAPAPLAPSSHMPCHKPRTHATGLWVAWSTRQLNSAVLKGLHRTYAPSAARRGYASPHFTLALAATMLLALSSATVTAAPGKTASSEGRRRM
jgi:hypothetical protein